MLRVTFKTKRIFPSFYSLVLGVVILLSGCGGGGSSSSSCSILNARVFNGDSCSNTRRTPVVSLAVLLEDGSAVSLCTGTLITVDDVLTSAHCLTRLLEIGNRIEAFGVVVGGTESGEVIPVVNKAIHPLYDGEVGSPFDVAMITLARLPSSPIGPLPLLLSEVTGPGSTITAFGYGKNEDDTDFTLRATTLTVTKIEGGNLYVVNKDSSTSICPGDSGGPAVYVTSTGASTLAGVNSFGIGRDFCENAAVEVSGFVDIQNSLILDFISNYASDAAVY